MQSTATITDFPQSLRERFGSTISFSTIAWVYWDGMDWCQYDEVLPTQTDKQTFEASYDPSEFVDARTFFSK